MLLAAEQSPLTPRQLAARKSATTRKLQTLDDRRLAHFLFEHADRHDYERREPSRFGGWNYFRPKNEEVEAALNGRRDDHLRKLLVDDVRRHRNCELLLRVTPTFNQHRATMVVRLDADAHAGETDAAALIAFLDETFFRPYGASIHAEPSDRGHSAYFVIEQALLPWRGDGVGPRGDGFYVARASRYNALLDQVDAALRRIARHHGFAAGVELNGRFTITERDESRRAHMTADGKLYDQRTWEPLHNREPTTELGDGDDAGRPLDFNQKTWLVEQPGERRLKRRGCTFRAPRCPRPGDVDRLLAARFPERVLHAIVRYAETLNATVMVPATPPSQPAGGPASAEVRPAAKRRPPRVRRAGDSATDDASLNEGRSNPHRGRFRALRVAAMNAGHLGAVACFADLPGHEQDRIVRHARAIGPAGHERTYRRDAVKLFETFDPDRAPGGEPCGRGPWAKQADFNQAVQIVTSKVGNLRLERMRALGKTRNSRGRLDRETIATALVCCAKNANVEAERSATGGKRRKDHCPVTAVIHWMAFNGFSVNGSWVKLAMDLLVEIGELAYVSKAYRVGKYARRIALVGAARRLPFIRAFYEDDQRRSEDVRPQPQRYGVNATIDVSGAGPAGRKKKLFSEGMLGNESARVVFEPLPWTRPWSEWCETRGVCVETGRPLARS